MKVLIVAATDKEIAPCLKQWDVAAIRKGELYWVSDNLAVLITGVGMTATAYWMGRALTGNNFDVAISAGIAGSFSKEIAIGEVVTVKSDTIADLGADDKDGFLSLKELGLAEREEYQFYMYIEKWDELKGLKAVNAISVNTVSGQQAEIDKLVERLNPDIESMEGAGFHLACHHSGMSSIQIRAISNYVEERDKANWNIKLAVKNLNKELIRITESLS